MENYSRKEIIQSEVYWEEIIKTELFQIIEDHLEEHQMKRKELAQQIGVSKGYISQVLNGECDHRISKLVSLAIAVGKAPFICLRDLEEVIQLDESGVSVLDQYETLKKQPLIGLKEFDPTNEFQFNAPNGGQEANIIPLTSDNPEVQDHFPPEYSLANDA